MLAATSSIEAIEERRIRERLVMLLLQKTVPITGFLAQKRWIDLA
jgi:hypothetical protein